MLRAGIDRWRPHIVQSPSIESYPKKRLHDRWKGVLWDRDGGIAPIYRMHPQGVGRWGGFHGVILLVFGAYAKCTNSYVTLNCKFALDLGASQMMSL